MSRYTYPGKKSRYRIAFGFDASLPLPSLFGAVEDLAWRTDGRVIEERGCTVVSLGCGNPPLRDLQLLVSALSPYVRIPLETQLQLLAEMDALKPLPLTALGKNLAAVCRQSPHARLAPDPPLKERVCLVVDAQGWQMRAFPGLEALAGILFPGEEAVLAAEDSYLRANPSIVCRFHEDSFSKEMPIFALMARGLALSGPIAISNETQGLTAEQLSLVAQEVFFVESALRPQVSRLWYHAWSTLASRGW